MAIHPDEFRDALRHFSAGVTIVTTRGGGRVHGMTVSAFASVSVSPPLVAAIIDQGHTINQLVGGGAGAFAVNLLAEDQRELADRFAFVRDEDRFEVGDWGEAVTGAPVLRDAVAWLDCEIRQRFPVGTHTIYIGEVKASEVCRPEELPLVYWNRDYRRLVALT